MVQEEVVCVFPLTRANPQSQLGAQSVSKGDQHQTQYGYVVTVQAPASYLVAVRVRTVLPQWKGQSPCLWIFFRCPRRFGPNYPLGNYRTPFYDFPRSVCSSAR